MVPIEPYWQRIRRLREARGLSRPDLSLLAGGVSREMLQAIETDPARLTEAQRQRQRYPSPTTLARVAKALDIEPDEFPEYRLALARNRLDDRVVGLDQALATLDAVERLMR
jgi:transcriptional regulator with XRE-family HTH domain